MPKLWIGLWIMLSCQEVMNLMLLSSGTLICSGAPASMTPRLNSTRSMLLIVRACQSTDTSRPPPLVKKRYRSQTQTYLWADMLFFMKSNGPGDLIAAGILMTVLILMKRKFLLGMGRNSRSNQFRETLFKIRMLLLFNWSLGDYFNDFIIICSCLINVINSKKLKFS
jgi:hypothetical protein